MSKVKFNVADKSIFTVAGIEFIKFPEVNGKVPVVAKNLLFKSRFGDINDFTNSDIRERLAEILEKIKSEIGTENICSFETDLTTLDGLKPYPALEAQIGIPTFDFVRQNVEIFDMYPVDGYWWTATPDSGEPHDFPLLVVCVSPHGDIVYDNCGRYNNGGVRPFLIFESSIFVSDGKEE